ncbi:carbohydrate-binding domain-containing protein [uncultured Treponema sp.]|uniref:carbohydrate-binding domain-containing protein n=1 Tax=uncultured Treponema sp. TaxID=162155 RepID=UPI0025DC4050|nr:carbohydrate-binding domain-containing protein [uncultured Treponema sp.]
MKNIKKIFTLLAAALLLTACAVDDESEFESTGSDTSSSTSSSTENSTGTATTGGTSTSTDSSSDSTGSTDSSDSSAESTNTEINPEDFASVLYIDLTEGKISADNSTWSEITTSKLSFSNDTISVKYTKDSGVSTGLVKIDATDFAGELAISITGTATTGGVKIQSNGTDAVTVSLNDVSISSSNYPCLEVTKGSPAIVFLNGTNTFVDGRAYGTGYGEEYSTESGSTYKEDGVTYDCTVVKSAVSEGSDSKGTLYSKGDLTISGSGSLSVTQAYKSCIASKSVLTINSGTYTLVSTGKSGLNGDSSVVVNGGTITFDGTGSISSSTFRKAHAIKTDTDDSTSCVYINGGTINVTTYNGKGINSSKVYIAGGTNTFNVTGVTNYTTDSNNIISYYDADGVYYSNQSVNFSAEGIEGASIVQISGGKTEVTSTDDGVNVSDSSGAFYMKDGYLYIYSTRGDGIDSNGNLYIQGGVVVSYAPTGSEDSFDSGNKIYITGGIIAGTSGSQMALNEYNTSGQKMLYFTGSSSGMGGPGGMGKPGQTSSSSVSKVAVQVNNSTVYAFTLPSSSFGLFVMSCPDFTSSSSSGYKVYTNPTISSSDFKGLCTTAQTLNAVSTGSTTATASIK